MQQFTVLLLRPSLKVHLPALETDLFLPVLPAAQTGQRDAGMAAKGFSSHAQLLTVVLDTFDLSIEKELVVLIQKVGNRNLVELREVQNQAPRQASCDTALDFDIHAAADTGDLGCFPLHKPFTMSEPAEPVRDTGDFFIGTVSLIHHGGFENLMRGAQPETMDI